MRPENTAENAVPVAPSPPKAVITILNALISGLLQSPLHGVLSNSTLVLSFKGRKSGHLYKFPVGYYDLQRDSVVVIPLHPWWKNLRGNVPVTAWLKGKKYAGVANATLGDDATVNEMEHLIAGSSNLIRIYKIQRDDQGHLDPERLRQVARSLALVRIRLTNVG